MGRHAAPGVDPVIALFEPAMIRGHASNADVIDSIAVEIRRLREHRDPTAPEVWIVADLAEALCAVKHPKLAAIAAHLLVRYSREEYLA